MSDTNAALTEQIVKVLKEKVQPALAEHFGGAQVTEVTGEGVVYVKMTGACGSCPAAEEELSGFIKELLTAECPEITDVRLDRGVSEDVMDFARGLLKKD